MVQPRNDLISIWKYSFGICVSTEVLQGHLLDLWAGLQGAGPLFLYVWLLGLGWTCQSPFWCSGTWPQGSRAFYTKA